MRALASKIRLEVYRAIGVAQNKSTGFVYSTAFFYFLNSKCFNFFFVNVQ